MKIDKWIKAIILYISLYLILNLLFLFFAQYLTNFLSFIWNSIPSSIIFLLLFILQEIVLLFLLWISFYYMRDKKFKNFWKYSIDYFKSKLHWKWWKFFFKYSLFPFFFYIFFVWFLFSILNKLNINIPWFFWEQKVANFLGWIPLSWFWDYFILFIIVAVIGPLIEEIIYRGFITNKLINRIGATWWIIISSLIFSFIHFEWQVFGNLFILSLILSYIYHRTWSICYSFWFHFLINFLWIIGIMLGIT